MKVCLFTLCCLSRPLNVLVGVRVEWLKARARAQRWEEEIRLLREEMRRILETFTWEASRWQLRTGQLGHNEDGGPMVSAELSEGLNAYAAEHAQMYNGLRASFEAAWVDIRREADTFLSRSSVLDEE